MGIRIGIRNRVLRDAAVCQFLQNDTGKPLSGKELQYEVYCFMFLHSSDRMRC